MLRHDWTCNKFVVVGHLWRTKWDGAREGRGASRPCCRSVTCKRREGRKIWVRRASKCSSIPRKFCPGWWGILWPVAQWRSSISLRRASWSHHAQPLTGAAPRKHGLGGGNCGSGQLCSLQQETWAACCHSCHRPDINVGCQTGQHSFSVWLVVQQNSRPWSIPLLLVVNDRLQRSAYCWLWLTDCIVLCMTHLFLRDNKSESAPKVSECESLNSEARMGLALLEKCS